WYNSTASLAARDRHGRGPPFSDLEGCRRLCSVAHQYANRLLKFASDGERSASSSQAYSEQRGASSRPRLTIFSVLTQLWRPPPERVAASSLEAFRRLAQRRFGRELPDYGALHAWSVAHPEEFWPLLAEFAQLPLEGSTERVRSEDPMPFTRWFPDVELNYARAMLYPASLVDPQQLALISEVEDGAATTLSYAELRQLVAAIQRSLGVLGIGKGDVVAAFSANIAENVALLLACAGLGAVYTSCSPDFGADAAAARFSQLDVKALFATTGYRYAGRWFDTTPTVSRLQEALVGS